MTVVAARRRSNSVDRDRDLERDDLETELDDLLGESNQDHATWSSGPNASSTTTTTTISRGRRRHSAGSFTSLSRLRWSIVNLVPALVMTCLGMLLVAFIAHSRPSLLRLPSSGTTTTTPASIQASNLYSKHGQSTVPFGDGSWSEYPVVNRVLLRPSTQSDEGVGTVLQRIRGSIMLATHVADAQFLLGEKHSEHNYTISELLNGALYKKLPHLLPIGKTCVLSHYLSNNDRRPMLEAVCSDRVGSRYYGTFQELTTWLEKATKLRQALEPCRIVIDDVWDELYEDMNGCSRGLIRERIGGISTRRAKGGSEGTVELKDDIVRVGVHVRWGDSSNPDPTTVESFRGSLDVSHINRIIDDMVKLYGRARLDIIVAMENHDDRLLNRFPQIVDTKSGGGYRLVDSGDGLADLKVLADNDVLLLGSSSYGVLSHILAAPEGLAIVEGTDDPGKYRDCGRESFLIGEYSSKIFKGLGERIPALRVNV